LISGVALVWYYLVLALALSAAILFGCCVAMDYSTYRDLQRRLREERRKKPQATASTTYAY
jgi:hypothetical protein